MGSGALPPSPPSVLLLLLPLVLLLLWAVQCPPPPLWVLVLELGLAGDGRRVTAWWWVML